jgi:hypothetical protein
MPSSMGLQCITVSDAAYPSAVRSLYLPFQGAVQYCSIFVPFLVGRPLWPSWSLTTETCLALIFSSLAFLSSLQAELSVQ